MHVDDALILCGDHDVFVVTLDDPVREVWRWRADEASGLPEAFRSRFGTTDDCKPVDGGGTILYFKQPERMLHFPDEPRLYKVRFNRG